MRFLNSGLEHTFYTRVNIDWDKWEPTQEGKLTNEERDIIMDQTIFYHALMKGKFDKSGHIEYTTLAKECGLIYCYVNNLLHLTTKRSDLNQFRLHAFQILAGDSTSYESPFFKALTDDYIFNQIVAHLGQDLTSKVFNKLTKLLNE